MKKNYIILALICLITGLNSCKKDFEEVNTNPVLALSSDPVYLFSNAQLNTALPAYYYQPEIVQQITTPSTGVLEGGNHNVYFDANSNIVFNYLFKGPTGGQSGGPVVLLIAAIEQTKNNPLRTNLYNMERILKAYEFMLLVDTYGDVPYSEAGKGYLEGINLPKYDNQQDIYDDILKELDEATKALDATKPIEAADLFYKGNIAQWKKLGNSLLLRAAMRFTKVDAAKAQKYVAIAVAGGLMQSNDDNAFIQFNSTFNNPTGSWFQATERGNIYLGAPFVNYLKATSDPRLNVISVKYANPASPLATVGAENTNPADQQGMPFGYNESTMASAPGFPGRSGAGYLYSQVNRRTLGKIDIPEFFVTYSQTTLLLAEAVQRGWATGTVSTLYAAGVKAHMDQLAKYDATATISPAAQNAYFVASPFDPTKALEQINTQYWVSSFLNGNEAWANFRRSGFPVLTPNPYPNADPAVKGGFIRRLQYPLREQSVNSANYTAAITHNGPDNMATRIFWDK
ncbi:SusD/RagB family nutrient-binding outer membrane lipoprotein [Mucilaginibacter sp.]|uniref:SusD/RagB family nutrient-binding outer membrane lipoprotein n=1 Tax=Mucilaginibacter sp. TaxID=1882438 RepID=UPI003563A8AC